jgi:hypothetical protein
MSRRYPIRAITHIHTRASNGPASEMNDMIGGCIRSLLGQDTQATWSECFTKVRQLEALLRSERVGLIAVTDHMNLRSHTLPDELLEAAAREPRLAACGEFSTIEQDSDGVFRRAPEVLIYGSPRRVAGPYGPHHGLSQAFIDELYETCRAFEGGELQTSRVLAHCERLDVACALAHPFDGHALSLETTLNVISSARFVETVNGGFPEISTRILEDLIAFQNQTVAGHRLPASTGLRFPIARRLAERITRQQRGLLHAWGGSDAHSHDFDRVVVRFLAGRPDPTAADLFAAMLRPIDDLLRAGTFSIVGRPGTAMSVVDDIFRIVLRNYWSIHRHLMRQPVQFLRLIVMTRKVVGEELARRAERQDELVRAAGCDFDSAHILREMVPPARRPAHSFQGEGLRVVAQLGASA